MSFISTTPFGVQINDLLVLQTSITSNHILSQTDVVLTIPYDFHDFLLAGTYNFNTNTYISKNDPVDIWLSALSSSSENNTLHALDGAGVFQKVVSYETIDLQSFWMTVLAKCFPDVDYLNSALISFLSKDIDALKRYDNMLFEPFVRSLQHVNHASAVDPNPHVHLQASMYIALAKHISSTLSSIPTGDVALSDLDSFEMPPLVVQFIAYGSATTRCSIVIVPTSQRHPLYPVVTLTGDAYITVKKDDPFVDPGATAYTIDNPELITLTADQDVTTSVAGLKTLTYTYSDKHNFETSVTRILEVLALTSYFVLPSTENLMESRILQNYFDGGGETITDTLYAAHGAWASFGISFAALGIDTQTYSQWKIFVGLKITHTDFQYVLHLYNSWEFSNPQADTEFLPLSASEPALIIRNDGVGSSAGVTITEHTPSISQTLKSSGSAIVIELGGDNSFVLYEAVSGNMVVKGTFVNPTHKDIIMACVFKKDYQSYYNCYGVYVSQEGDKTLQDASSFFNFN